MDKVYRQELDFALKSINDRTIFSHNQDDQVKLLRANTLQLPDLDPKHKSKSHVLQPTDTHLTDFKRRSTVRLNFMTLFSELGNQASNNERLSKVTVKSSLKDQSAVEVSDTGSESSIKSSEHDSIVNRAQFRQRELNLFQMLENEEYPREKLLPHVATGILMDADLMDIVSQKELSRFLNKVQNGYV